ncbi:hypothetical protein TUM3794_05000 [Shewanella colwelliana]|uniref:Transposase DDE domain-containing protein n=1 Tax=Shewanella colwelliana TaxID=23 RepID=A0ABQ4NV35_SHECO|nr:hypothetical protein TUM3794_05000 [Shewanella colwelliana]
MALLASALDCRKPKNELRKETASGKRRLVHIAVQIISLKRNQLVLHAHPLIPLTLYIITTIRTLHDLRKYFGYASE